MLIKQKQAESSAEWSMSSENPDRAVKKKKRKNLLFFLICSISDSLSLKINKNNPIKKNINPQIKTARNLKCIVMVNIIKAPNIISTEPIIIWDIILN